VVAFSVVVRAISGAARTSEISSTALDGLAALSYVGLILAALWTLSRLRQRRQTQALAASEAAQRDAVARSGWLMLAWFGGHVAVLVALVAALWGYINFALFAASQMVWMTVVIMATLLLLKFVGDWASWLLSPVSRSGKALMQATDLSASRLEQGGVLLSALLRVAVMLLSVGAITAPYGNVDALFSWVDVFTQGVTIGGAVLKPGAVLWALVVLAIGLTVFNTFQRWLVETYLPKTELDIGARNSISTVARYAGICLTALWALAALGLGFEKLALVASALSVGIGFGLQAITQNFVSGLILLAERPVKLGDRIYIGDQIGDVRRINVRATEVQLDDKSTLIVPNSELITKPVRNLTMGTPLGRIQIKFTMPASTDVVALKGLLLSVYNAHELVLESPAPAVYIDGISDGAITLNSFAHVGSPRSVYAVRSELLFAVIACLAQEKLPLVTPADIHVIVDPQPDPATQAQPVPPTPQVGPVQAAPGGAR
jgi:small-conductance mechanosensitive channel